MVEHYFSEKPMSRFKVRKLNVKVRGFNFKINLASGTFSSRRIDKGTLLLAESMKIKQNDVVLDLGCGNGLVGIVASFLTKNKVYMIDVNERACSISKINAEQNGANVKVLCGNKFEPVKRLRFDTIVLNPPQTAGNKLCFEMVKESYAHLKRNGTLQLVARHNKGGKTLSKMMQEVFNNVNVIAKKGGYWLYVSQKDL